MADVQKDLRLYYNGVDITRSVDILECTVRDVSRRESDCLNLLVDHAEKWFSWGVQKNDTLRITRSGYDTKTMYLNTLRPEDGRYRIYATGSKSVQNDPRWASYENRTLAAILGSCAGESGMGVKLCGVSGEILYEYLTREYMRAADFAEQLLNREGAVLKCMDGKYTAIGIEWAQKIGAKHQVNIGGERFETHYTDKRDMNWGAVEITTPFGSGKAGGGKGNVARVITDLPVTSNAQAFRWARGILMNHNRQNEVLEIEMDFNPGYTAMVRIDVNSKTETGGQWIIDEVTHDLLHGSSKAILFRCI